MKLIPLLSQLGPKLERLLHPKIKEVIAKSLVYFFTIKDRNEFSKARYQGYTHVLAPYSHLLNIAHRGFSGKYPENTLLAFRQALAEQADMLELDIQITQDQEIVVAHDAMLSRTAGRQGYIRDLPWADLQQSDVGSWFQADYASERLPSLKTVAQSFEQALINIEIKHEATRFINRQTEKRLLALIQEHHLESRVVISSFNPMIVHRIRKLAPHLSTAYLITQTLNPLLIYLLTRVKAAYVHVDLRYLNPRSVAGLKKAGIKVVAYTLNSPAEFEHAVQLGLDGILTDYPDRLRSFLQQQDLLPAKSERC